jgi:tRNA threonylcarbamoyl adenosine modification protein YjeE
VSEADPELRLDEAGTEMLGRLLAGELSPPAFVALRGPLGAGKSVLARAMGRALGVKGTIPSPTYPLLLRHRLPGGGSLVHLDLYRLNDPEQIWELGWEELPGADEIVVVEWPERAGVHLPTERLDVALGPVDGIPESRRVSVRGATGGVRGDELLARVTGAGAGG